MAYATRFYFEFVSDSGISYRIDIQQDGFEGTPIQRPLGADPVLRRDKSGNILGTSLEFAAECRIDGEFADLYALDAYEYKVDLTSDGMLLFTGFLVPETYAEPDMAPPYDVQLMATDCLGELKSYDFEGSSSESVANVIRELLLHTGLSLREFAFHSLGFTSHQNHFWERLYLNWEWLNGKSEYYVLQQILATFNAKIMQLNGSWLIVRETDMTDFYRQLPASLTALPIIYTTTDYPDFRTSAPLVGSIDDTGWWPIGELSLVAEPAKRAVTVFAENVYKDDIIGEDWVGVTPVDGSYTLSAGAEIAKTISFQSHLSEPTVLSFVASNQSPRASRQDVSLDIQIIRHGLNYYGDEIHEYLKKVDDEYKWSTVESSIEVILSRSDTEDPLIEIDIPFAIPEAGSRVSAASAREITSLQFSIQCQHNSAVISDIVLYNTLTYNGMKDEVVIQNGAREKADDIQVMFSAPAGSQYVRASQTNFLVNIPRRSNGEHIDTFWTNKIDDASFVEVMGVDYATAMASPRWRCNGKINVPSAGETPAFFSFRSQLFLLETFRWDLLVDEMEIDMLSVPVVTVEAESVITSGLPGEDTTSRRTGSHSGNTVNVTVARVTRTAYEVWLDAGYIGDYNDFLAFIQGNSGYSGAVGELEVVNNLTQGGATAALSAEMGKQLKVQVDDIRENLPAIREVEVSGDGNVVTHVDVDPDDIRKLVVVKGLSAMKSVALSYAAYRELIYEGTADPQTWYCVYSDAEPYPLMRVYIGDTLFASRDSGSAGFAYNFPISF